LYSLTVAILFCSFYNTLYNVTTFSNLFSFFQPRKKPRPPSTGHASRLRQLPGSGRALGHLNRNLCLPPVGHTRHSPLALDDRTNLSEALSFNESISALGEQSRSAKSSRSRKLVDNAECLSRLSHTLSSVKENSNVKETSIEGKDKVKEEKSQKETSSSEKKLLKPEEKLSKSDTEKPPSETKTDETLPLPSSASKKDTSSVKESVKPSTKAKQLLNNDITIENLKEVLGRPNTSSRDLMLESLQETFGRPTTSSRYKGMERRKEFTLESLSTSEARAMSGLLRQASLEKIGSSRIGNFTGSKSRLGNYSIGPSVQDGRITTPEGRLVVGLSQ